MDDEDNTDAEEEEAKPNAAKVLGDGRGEGSRYGAGGELRMGDFSVTTGGSEAAAKLLPASLLCLPLPLACGGGPSCGGLSACIGAPSIDSRLGADGEPGARGGARIGGPKLEPEPEAAAEPALSQF